MELLEAFIEVAVERRVLVRILTIAEPRHEGQCERERGFGHLLLVEKIADRPVVLGGFEEGLDREAFAHLRFVSPS